VVTLDDRYYAFIDQMEERFPSGPPSLVECEKLEVVGDVRFGRDVVVTGTVRVENTANTPRFIPDRTTLAG
jgi:UTP--glucose-1-phosphate uridylyltransferase